MKSEFAEETAPLRMIAGDTVTIKFVFYRDSNDPISLGSCKDIVWSLAPYGMNGPAIVVKKKSSVGGVGISVPDTEGDEVDGEGLVNNVCYVTLYESDTKALSGKYEYQMVLTDLKDQKFRKVRGTIIISRANED